MKVELHKMIGEPELENSPILILGNKQDLPNPMTEEEIEIALDLYLLPRNTVWKIHLCSAMSLADLHTGMDWITDGPFAKSQGFYSQKC